MKNFGIQKSTDILGKIITIARKGYIDTLRELNCKLPQNRKTKTFKTGCPANSTWSTKIQTFVPYETLSHNLYRFTGPYITLTFKPLSHLNLTTVDIKIRILHSFRLKFSALSVSSNWNPVFADILLIVQLAILMLKKAECR